MKKIIQQLLLFPVLIIVMINQAGAQTEDEKIAAFDKEADWELIRAAHLEILDKLVGSPVDLATVDFNDEAAFLKLIQLTKEEYLYKRNQVKAAASRLIEKYAIDPDCGVCKQDDGEIVNQFQAIAVAYQRNADVYKNYRAALYSDAEGSAAGWCCRWKFYACCTVCAATIAAFPAYVACCALCFDTYCCKV